jgi:hypothetical protein
MTGGGSRFIVARLHVLRAGLLVSGWLRDVIEQQFSAIMTVRQSMMW